MQAKILGKIDGQIQRVREQLAQLGPMRPGTLTRQYRHPKERSGPFWQISYTHQMKSRTEYVRESELAEARREIAAFRRYKKLTARWVDLALRRSQRRVQWTRSQANPAPGQEGKTRKSSPPAGHAANIQRPL